MQSRKILEAFYYMFLSPLFLQTFLIKIFLAMVLVFNIIYHSYLINFTAVSMVLYYLIFYALLSFLAGYELVIIKNTMNYMFSKDCILTSMKYDFCQTFKSGFKFVLAFILLSFLVKIPFLLIGIIINWLYKLFYPIYISLYARETKFSNLFELKDMLDAFRVNMAAHIKSFLVQIGFFALVFGVFYSWMMDSISLTSFKDANPISLINAFLVLPSEFWGKFLIFSVILAYALFVFSYLIGYTGQKCVEEIKYEGELIDED